MDLNFILSLAENNLATIKPAYLHYKYQLSLPEPDRVITDISTEELEQDLIMLRNQKLRLEELIDEVSKRISNGEKTN